MRSMTSARSARWDRISCKWRSQRSPRKPAWTRRSSRYNRQPRIDKQSTRRPAAAEPPSRELIFSRLHRFDQIDQRMSRAPLRNLRKRLNQAQRQRIGQEIERRRIVAFRERRFASLKQREDRNAEDHADFEKTAAADAVRAFLVFLYLLKRNSELVCQVGL